MEKLGKELIFISRIKRDGSGVEHVYENYIQLIQEIYNKRREILHSSDLIDEIHDLQSRYNAIELRLDSAHVEIDVLKQGKLPVDSVWINSETGWRKFHVKTKWLWRRRD